MSTEYEKILLGEIAAKNERIKELESRLGEDAPSEAILGEVEDRAILGGATLGEAIMTAPAGTEEERATMKECVDDAIRAWVGGAMYQPDALDVWIDLSCLLASPAPSADCAVSREYMAAVDRLVEAARECYRDTPQRGACVKSDFTDALFVQVAAVESAKKKMEEA